jgi:hypothetical protein
MSEGTSCGQHELHAIFDHSPGFPVDDSAKRTEAPHHVYFGAVPRIPAEPLTWGEIFVDCELLLSANHSSVMSNITPFESKYTLHPRTQMRFMDRG